MNTKYIDEMKKANERILELQWFFSFQVAHVSKFSENSGLGISLEATVGHHFIRSVLPEGPVGHSGKLFSGDELLEVRNYAILPYLK